MTVHNHGIDPSCRERKVGECLLKPGAVVLDLADAPDYGQPVVQTLREIEIARMVGPTNEADTITWLIEQIEAQTKPPRIPEPGKWGVVKAKGAGLDRIEWVNEGKWWVSMGGDPRPHWVSWDQLVDPVLVREGI